MNGVGPLGVIALAMVLLVVLGIALLRLRFDGRIRTAVRPGAPDRGGLHANRRTGDAVAGGAPSLSDIGIAVPADQVAVVQFSGEFCAICTPARTLVQRVLRDHPDIARIEVDVAEHLTAVRALDIRRTPTLLIVDEQGQVVHRSSGMPREAELRQAVSGLAAYNR
ncbi:MAG: thioredoxin family protein [Actinomycetota bacterium]|nr:thioredoxin family protein [Actinomycetota bacterium]